MLYETLIVLCNRARAISKIQKPIGNTYTHTAYTTQSNHKAKNHTEIVAEAKDAHCVVGSLSLSVRSKL